MTSLHRVGIVKTTLIDYPGRVAAAIYLPGCNLRCPYCHNPRLVDGSPLDDLPTYQEALELLRKRRPVLGGVCVSGGEPSLRTDIADIIGDIKEIGLDVKLDTNGTRPEVLKTLKPDYIAMDLKTVPERYPELAASAEEGRDLPEKIRESIRFVIDSGIPHEFRTTLAPGIAGYNEVRDIAELITGTDRYVLAEFRPGTTLDPEYTGEPGYSREEIESMKEAASGRGFPVEIRFLTP